MRNETQMRSATADQHARRRPLRCVPLLAIALSLAFAAAFPSLASATQIHYYAGTTFGEPGSGAGQLSLREPAFAATPRIGGSSLAVDESSGDVYVADTENHRVSEFDPSGAFLRAFGWGVADGAAELQSCTIVCQAGIAGTAPGQLEAPTFLAVDDAPGGEGDVYVGDNADGTITKFSASGALIPSWAEGGQLKSGPSSASFIPLGGIGVDGGQLLVFGNPRAAIYRFDRAGSFVSEFLSREGLGPSGLALDRESTIYLTDGRATVNRYTPEGTFLGRVTPTTTDAGSPVTGLTASEADEALYADQGGAAIGAYARSCDRSVGFCEPFQRFGEGAIDSGAGLAIDSPAGTLYAASTEADQIAVFPVAIEAVTQPPDEVTASSATLHATVNPEGAELSGCRFEYGEGGAEGGLSVPCAETPAQIGAGRSPVPVEAAIGGLSGAAAYSFRLRATNQNGDVKAEELQFHTLEVPGISGVLATGVEGGSATLNAQIDPHGSATHYRFEWGPCAGTCAASPYPNSTPEGELAEGASATTVTAALSGLSAATTYHFRASATNDLGTATSPEHTFVEEPMAPIETGCPNETLRQLDNSSALPDCRAYELVTPPEKNGSLIGGLLFGQAFPQIAPGGEALGAPAVQCLAHTPGCIGHRSSEGQLYDFIRTPAGWQANPLAPSAAAFQTDSWWSTAVPGSGRTLFSAPDSEGREVFYVREPDGSSRRVGPFGNKADAHGDLPGISTMPSEALIVSTPDFSRIVYSQRVPTWSFDEGEPNARSLYEYMALSGGVPELVGVSGPHGSTDLISACGTGLGGGNPDDAANGYNPLSEDGAIVWFTASECQTGTGANAGVAVPVAELYERIEGSRTIEASAPTPSSCTTAACRNSKASDAEFEGASRDGRFVLFTSTQKLTDEASEDAADTASAASRGCTKTPSSASGCNLYASFCPAHCEDPSQRRLIDLSAGAQALGGPKVQGAIALSPDGSRTYFVAKGLLTSTPNARGQEAQEGAENLYLYRRDPTVAQGSLSFVATLSPHDLRLWGSGDEAQLTNTDQGLGLANITPDGRYLVFPSHRGLTADSQKGEGSAQIYRFDSDGGTLVRVSIGEQGFGDNGNSGAASANASIVAGSVSYVSGNGAARANPSVSDDGRYVFFQSPLALTPGAADELVVEELPHAPPTYAQNIYEWEEAGTPGCEQVGGCVSLLSDGREAFKGGVTRIATPELLGTDASGKNVFIAAGDPLTWQDTDTQRDFYDLRIDGGFAPPGESPPCAGDGCRGPANSAPSTPVPGTSVSSGPEEGPRHPRRPKRHHKKRRRHHRGHHASRSHHGSRGTHHPKGAGR